MAKGSNQLDKCTPEDGITLPSHWRDWNRELSLEEYKSIPLKFEFKVDLHHIVENPVPMQPAKTRHEAFYKFYFISPNKIVLFIRTEGFDYTFCDRFCPEHLYEFTQSVSDGAMQE